MSLTAAFTASQSPLSPSTITLVDTSTGSDSSIDGRRVYFQTTYGTYLVQSGTTTDYEVWSYADSTASFNVLTEDFSLAITVQWVSGSTVLYSLTQLYCFKQYDRNFFYFLFQQQALSPIVPLDTNYYMNVATLWANIIGANESVETGADIASSQNALNRATFMRINEQDFF